MKVGDHLVFPSQTSKSRPRSAPAEVGAGRGTPSRITVNFRGTMDYYMNCDHSARSDSHPTPSISRSEGATAAGGAGRGVYPCSFLRRSRRSAGD